MTKKIEMLGQRFGKLIVLKESGKTPDLKDFMWVCQCECGNQKIVRGRHLRRGAVSTCGCLQKTAATTHGMSYTSTYGIWRTMTQRCNNPKNGAYGRYGGRGIKVCERWLKFENFLADMGERPPGLTLDRVNNNGNYCLENCRWVTWKEQYTNTRQNHRISYQGKTQTVTEWARELKIKSVTLSGRLSRGWSIERALTTPVRKINKSELF